MPTIGFNNKSNKWTSKYTYAASCFGRVNNKFFSSPASPTTNGSYDSPIWEHDKSSDYNKFYGETKPSKFSVTFADNPSQNKIYKSLSLEGTKNLNGSLCVVKTSNNLDKDGSPDTNVNVDIVRNINGTSYGPVGRDRTMVPGKTFVILGRVIRNRGGNGVEPVDPNTEGTHGAYYKVFLDPTTGITPQVHQNQEVRMKVAAMAINADVATVFYGANSSETLSSVIGQPFSSISPKSTSEALLNENRNVSAYSPIDNSFNYESNDAGLSISINGLINLTDDVYLVGLVNPEFAGDTARGQYVECSVEVPASKGYFEVFCANLNYEPIQLAHDK
mgnify:CR=1 FL=1|tara:strand:+ start:3641 stop:4639 length:999 start_codon:yes stop_codon:yes gene_type:complete